MTRTGESLCHGVAEESYNVHVHVELLSLLKIKYLYFDCVEVGLLDHIRQWCREDFG